MLWLACDIPREAVLTVGLSRRIQGAQKAELQSLPSPSAALRRAPFWSFQTLAAFDLLAVGFSDGEMKVPAYSGVSGIHFTLDYFF